MWNIELLGDFFFSSAVQELFLNCTLDGLIFLKACFGPDTRLWFWNLGQSEDIGHPFLLPTFV